MPNDAKLGLVVGVGLVVAIAIVFFRKDSTAADAPAATNVSPASAAPPASASPTKSTSQRRHTVQEGETLFSLAEQYYGDGRKYNAIYRVNRSQLDSPEDVAPGTVLIIPQAPDQVAEKE
jgi:nucleoid-associated protein YgaU